jgi:hypothetical protein
MKPRHVLTVLVLVAGCSPAASPTPTGSPTAAPASPTPEQTHTATPKSVASTIVGTWHRKQTCDELIAAFRAARLLESHKQ